MNKKQVWEHYGKQSAHTWVARPENQYARVAEQETTVQFLSESCKLLQQRTLIAKKTEIYMSLKPSNMISMQFLTMTVDLIIKFCVDLSSRN